MDQNLSFRIGIGQAWPENVTADVIPDGDKTVGTGVASQQSRAFDREIHNDDDNHGP